MAETVDVSAQNLAPVPTVQAAIASPQNNTTVTNDSLTINGTCEQLDPRIIIVIERGGEPIGSVQCGTDGTFRLVVQLIAGENTLIARSLTITDEYGPDSTPLIITYTAPVTPPTPTPTPTPNPPAPSPSPSPSPTPEPVPIKPTTDTPFSLRVQPIAVQYTAGNRFQLDIAFDGGTAPYELRIDWGDGDIDQFRSLSPGTQTLYHTYQNISDKTIRVSATDKLGTSRSISVATVGRMTSSGAINPIQPSQGDTTVLGVRPRDAAIIGVAAATVLTILLQGTIQVPTLFSSQAIRKTSVVKKTRKR